jgi:predicted RNA binding protein YcfA (HicA-like mRNA interferase family)
MRIPSLTPKQLVRILHVEGFKADHQTGSHVTLRHPDGRRAVVPLHGRELKRGTLLGIIKQAGYSPNDFFRLL